MTAKEQLSNNKRQSPDNAGSLDPNRDQALGENQREEVDLTRKGKEASQGEPTAGQRDRENPASETEVQQELKRSAPNFWVFLAIAAGLGLVTVALAVFVQPS